MSDQPLENVDAAIDDAREAARRLEMGEGDITTDDTDFSAPAEQPRRVELSCVIQIWKPRLSLPSRRCLGTFTSSNVISAVSEAHRPTLS